MASPYSGLYPIITPREKHRLYEIIERCGSMGLGYPMWFEDQYNGIIESMPPNVFMKFLDALVLEGELFYREAQKVLSEELKATFDYKKEHPETTPKDFGDEFSSWQDINDEHTQGITISVRCYQDAAKIRRNVIARYKKWYARDYGLHHPLESLNAPRYDATARTNMEYND